MMNDQTFLNTLTLTPADDHLATLTIQDVTGTGTWTEAGEISVSYTDEFGEEYHYSGSIVDGKLSVTREGVGGDIRIRQ